MHNVCREGLFLEEQSIHAEHIAEEPYDKAAMENFFGTLKTECLYRAHFTTRTEGEQLVTEYVNFYNFERISLKNGLTPLEFRGKTA